MKTFLLIAGVLCSQATKAQRTATQSLTTDWGKYVNTELYAHGNTILQVNVEGQNCAWHGVFTVNGTNSYTPDITWNNVKLISWSGYNTSVDDVKALIMSGTSTTGYGGTTIVFKLEQPAIGSTVFTVIATTAGTYTFSLILSGHTSPPFAYTMASSAGTYNMWTVDNKVGIGTNAPKTRLDLGELRLSPITSFPSEGSILEGDWGNYIIGDVTTSQKLRLGVSNDLYSRAEIFLDNSNRQDGTIAFKTANSGGGALTRMFINGNGNVGIGTESIDNAAYKLYVETGIRTRKVKVDQATWPDYVFRTTYRLRPLSEVEQYIKLHHHLPEVPSEEEVKKEGLDVGENQAMLLKKIEELTLYVIEQNEINKEQAKKLEQQQREIEALRNLIRRNK